MTTPTSRVVLRMGNPFAPTSPWGRDELEIHDDGRVAYRNQRGNLARASTAQLSEPAIGQLFAALAASPFPVWASTGLLPPGSTLVELTAPAPAPAGEATITIDYHTALKAAGYAPGIKLLTGWAAILRAVPDKRAASAELTQIVDQPAAPIA